MPVGDENAAEHRPVSKLNARLLACVEEQCAADLRASGISVGVQDARKTMRGFAGQQERASFSSITIEACTPLDQLFDAARTFVDEHLGGRAIDKAVACVFRVFEVKHDIFRSGKSYGDAA